MTEESMGVFVSSSERVLEVMRHLAADLQTMLSKNTCGNVNQRVCMYVHVQLKTNIGSSY